MSRHLLLEIKGGVCYMLVIYLLRTCYHCGFSYYAMTILDCKRDYANVVYEYSKLILDNWPTTCDMYPGVW